MQRLQRLIADTGGRFDWVAPLINTFLQHRVEGLFYIAEYHQTVTLPPLPAGHPLVLVNCFDDIGTPVVLPDDRRGQRELVARIIAGGHRRIGHLTLLKTQTPPPAPASLLNCSMAAFSFVFLKWSGKAMILSVMTGPCRSVRR